MSDNRSSSEPNDSGHSSSEPHDFGEDGDDGGDDDDDDGEGGGDFGGLGGGEGAGGAGGGSGENEEGSVQLLPDTEDDEADDDDNDDDDDDDEKLTDKQRREKDRKKRAKKRAKAEARAKRDEKKFQIYLNELSKGRAIKETSFPLSTAPSADAAEVLMLNEFLNTIPTPSKGIFRPLFICLPSPKSRLSSVLASFLIQRFSLPLMADITSPLFPELSHINRALPAGPLRIYGRVEKDNIERKIYQKKTVATEEKKRKDSKQEKKEKEGETAKPAAPTMEKVDVPPLFVLTSDLLLSTVTCSSTTLLYSTLVRLLITFSERYGITHLFLLSSLPITLSFNLKGRATDITKKELERLIKRAAKIGDNNEGEDNNNTEGGEPGGEAGGSAADGVYDNIAGTGGHGHQLSGSSKTHEQPRGDGDSKPASASSAAAVGSGGPRSPRSKSPKFKTRTAFLKKSNKKKTDDDEDEDADMDPADKAEEAAEKLFLTKQLQSFMYYSSTVNDAKILQGVGGRLISSALLSGLIASFFNYAIRPPASSSTPSAPTSRGPSIILLSAYYNPLLSDLFAAVKIATTINKFIDGLPADQQGSVPLHLDLIQLQEKAGKVSKKIKKALLHSISETADSAKQPSMYM